MAKAGRPVGSNVGAAPSFTRQQLKGLLAYAATTKKPKQNVAFLQVLLCSLRCKEAVSLTRGNVQAVDGSIVETFGLSAANTKGGKFNRLVFLTRSARLALTEHLADLPEGKDVRLFDFSANYASFLASKICSEAGFPSHTAHSFRRTCCTLLQKEKNMPIQNLQTLMGHRSISNTRLYLDTSPAPIQDAFRNLQF